MAKRRTKKQKIKAKRQFTVSWEPTSDSKKPRHKTGLSKAIVKGQFKNQTKANLRTGSKQKYALFSGKASYLASIKKDLLKSVMLASLILALEVVIYLAWT